MASKKQELEWEFDRLRARIFSAQKNFDENIDVLQEELRTLGDKLEALKKEKSQRRFIREPQSGAIIRFSKAFDGRSGEYSYAALRYSTHWFLTQDGTRSSSALPPMTWEELREFIGDATITQMTYGSTL